MDDTDVETVYHVPDLTGVFANALLGGVIGRREKLDPVGFAVLAILSDLGGGLIRDVLLQAGPPAALLEPTYHITALVVALIAYPIRIEGRSSQQAKTSAIFRMHSGFRTRIGATAASIPRSTAPQPRRVACTTRSRRTTRRTSPPYCSRRSTRVRALVAAAMAWLAAE